MREFAWVVVQFVGSIISVRSLRRSRFWQQLTPLLTASLALRLSRAFEPTALLGSQTLRVSLPARLAAQQPAFDQRESKMSWLKRC